MLLFRHTLVFGDLFCLYRVLKYYSNIEYPPHRPHTKFLFCKWLVKFFWPTAHNFLTALKNWPDRLRFKGIPPRYHPGKRAVGESVVGQQASSWNDNKSVKNWRNEKTVYQEKQDSKIYPKMQWKRDVDQKQWCQIFYQRFGLKEVSCLLYMPAD